MPPLYLLCAQGNLQNINKTMLLFIYLFLKCRKRREEIVRSMIKTLNNMPPSCPKEIIAAHAPAIRPPGRLPAIVGETYKPPDHSVTVTLTEKC